MAMGQEETRDEDLMAQIATGDEEAFRRLIERHQDRVYGTVAKMLGGTGPDVEELAQEIFLRVWRAAPRYQVKAKFTTWLMTITRNLVFTFFDSAGKKREEFQETMESEDDFAGGKGGCLKRTAADELSGKELAEAVEKACAELSHSQRMVVHLRQYEGMEFEEIAKVMGMSLTAVKALMFRARENLREKLSGFLGASH
ncbi:sigma-70 family RNA polymerase sigma factor [bacterium]|jgi:RNA polymerase sigma-70 factor (ECF subfamily)|nr:sigma-70 family RNA polymerase sigma factor [bacterium]